MTGRDAIAASLRLIGVLASGESASSAEATDGLSTLNRMISSWSIEGLIIHAETREQWSLTEGDGSYTIGSSGDLNTTRPLEILSAFIRSEAATPATDYPPLKILSLAEWAEISQKESGNAIPQSLYEDGGFPLRTIYLHPKPSASLKLVIHSKKQLTELSTLDTSISLPPGYDEALVYGLAARLAPEYGKSVPDAVAMIAAETKAAIKRANHKPSYLKVDDALLGGGAFDITTGGF